MLAYAAAPAGSVGAGYLVIGAGLVLLWVFLWGAKYGYDWTLGALLRNLADHTRGIRWIGGKIAAVFDNIDDFVLDAIGNGLTHVESGMTKWWHGMEWVIRQTGDAIVAFGADVHASIDNLVHGTVPTLVDAGVRPVTTAVGKTRTIIQTKVVRVERTVTAKTADLAREIDHVFGLARRGIDYITKVRLPQLTHALEGVRVAERALGRLVHDVVNWRLTRLDKLVVGAAMTGTVLAVLTRYFPYWRCTNVRAFNKMLCRAPIGALDDLLGLAVLVFGAFSIVDFAEELQAVMGVASSGVRSFVTEVAE